MSRLRAVLGRVRSLPRKLEYEWGRGFMSWLRKRWIVLANPHATVSFGPGVYLGPGFKLDLGRGATFIVGADSEFRRGFYAEVHPFGEVRIGARAVLSHGSLFQITTSLTLGDDCNLGQCTGIFDGAHRFRDPSVRMLDQGYDYRPLRIEDGVTVMTKVTITHNIGERAVIGAHAVVTKPIPPYTLAVGVPARPVDYFGPSDGEGPEAESKSITRPGETSPGTRSISST